MLLVHGVANLLACLSPSILFQNQNEIPDQVLSDEMIHRQFIAVTRTCVVSIAPG